MAGLHAVLDAAGLRRIGGTDLFRLVDAGDAAALQGRLARAGIWTRIFDGRPEWMRFGLPPDAEGEGQLRRALAG